MTTHDWRAQFSDKIATAAEATALIRPGRRILIGSGAAEPGSLVEALVTHGMHLSDNEIVHLLTLGPAPYVKRELSHRFRHSAFFIGANVREAVQEGRADFIPVFLSEIPQLLRSRALPIDVALVHVSPPDAHGYCSLGVSVDVSLAAVESARRVVAQLNPRMPRTHGDGMIHVADVDAFVEVDRPLFQHARTVPGDVEKRIAVQVADLIEDGSTLQMGIGSIPDAVLAALDRHRDLGVHTEMFSDGLVDLVEAGVVTNKFKKIARDKIVSGFVVGSQKLYDFVHDNPRVLMLDIEYVNDTAIIRQNPKVIAINSAIEVDITGQVVSDSIGATFFSGIGGQMDFMRGAALSEGGKAIIALPSRTSRGEPRIVPCTRSNAGVVTTRGHIQYVVTEWGVASLYGKSIRERVEQLVSVAHPDDRAALLERARELGWN
jgi:acyl-CoA hydrolase